MTSTIITAGAGTALTYARYGNDPAELRKKLTVENMAKWGVARNTFGGVPTMGVDAVMGLAGHDGFFNARYSNLDTGVSVDSSPAIVMMNRLFVVGKRMALLAQGKPFSGDDIDALSNLTPASVFPSAKKAIRETAVEQLGIRSKDRR